MATHLIETASEATFSFRAVIPLLVDDPEGNILIRWTGDKANQASVLFAGGCEGLTSLPPIFALDLERGSSCAVNQVWIEDVKLVTLYYLRWRVVVVIMGLVVLVPLVAELDSVEVTWLARLDFVRPCRFGEIQLFLHRESFFVLAEPTCGLTLVQSTCRARAVIVICTRFSGN